MFTAQKMKFADLVIFTEEVFKGMVHLKFQFFLINIFEITHFKLRKSKFLLFEKKYLVKL